MTVKSPPAVDLLGDPWSPPRDPRGRKRHKPSAQGREFVAKLKGGRATDEEIALQMGLSEPTLRKYYFRELKHGPALARNSILQKLYDAGMAGNVSAMKAYLAEAEKARALQVQRPDREPRSPAKGKKEERLDAAASIGGLYAPGAAPKTH
jgi:hypothetical protein